jgi:Arc/MetJ family transcription regulator
VRTNIELDPALVEEAFRYTDVRTKKDLVHLALREFIRQRRRLDPRELRGKIAFAPDYDHERLRGEAEDA